MKGLYSQIIASSYNTTVTPVRIIQNGLLVSYDPADPVSYPGSGTILYDLKGNANMTLYNGMDSGWNSNGWFSLDGVNDYAQSSTLQVNTTSNTNGYTLGFWAEWNNVTSADIAAQLVTGTYTGFLAYTISSNIRMRYDGTSQYNSDYVGTINNKWYYVVMTYRYINSTTSYLTGYVGNGGANTIQQYALNYNVSWVDGNKPLRISHPNSNQLAGSVGEYHFYERELSQTEVNTNYNQTKARYGY